jgi:hypothetical protein
MLGLNLAAFDSEAQRRVGTEAVAPQDTHRRVLAAAASKMLAQNVDESEDIVMGEERRRMPQPRSKKSADTTKRAGAKWSKKDETQEELKREREYAEFRDPEDPEATVRRQEKKEGK